MPQRYGLTPRQVLDGAARRADSVGGGERRRIGHRTQGVPCEDDEWWCWRRRADVGQRLPLHPQAMRADDGAVEPAVVVHRRRRDPEPADCDGPCRSARRGRDVRRGPLARRRPPRRRRRRRAVRDRHRRQVRPHRPDRCSTPPSPTPSCTTAPAWRRARRPRVEHRVGHRARRVHRRPRRLVRPGRRACGRCGPGWCGPSSTRSTCSPRPTRASACRRRRLRRRSLVLQLDASRADADPRDQRRRVQRRRHRRRRRRLADGPRRRGHRRRPRHQPERHRRAAPTPGGVTSFAGQTLSGYPAVAVNGFPADSVAATP